MLKELLKNHPWLVVVCVCMLYGSAGPKDHPLLLVDAQLDHNPEEEADDHDHDGRPDHEVQVAHLSNQFNDII